MNNQYKHPHILFLFLVLLLTSCEKLDIPDDKEDAQTETGNTSDTTAEGDYYTVGDILNQRNDSDMGVSVVGYIVGYVNGTKMKSSTFATGDVRTNILLADTPVEKDSTKCIPVQLTTSNEACKATRMALNLCDNPEMLHQKIQLKGDVTIYMGVTGLHKAHAHTLLQNDFDYAAWEAAQQEQPDDSSEEENTDTPDGNEDDDNGDDGTGDEITDKDEDNDTPTDNDDTSDKDDEIIKEIKAWFNEHGTESSPLTINDFKTTLKEYFPIISEDYTITNMYVKGYIVGYYTASNKVVHFDKNSNKTYATNIVLADSPDETNKNNCIVVELPSNSKVRQELNLFDNKRVFNKLICVKGSINKYGIDLGVTNTKDYQLLE